MCGRVILAHVQSQLPSWCSWRLGDCQEEGGAIDATGSPRSATADAFAHETRALDAIGSVGRPAAGLSVLHIVSV